MGLTGQVAWKVNQNHDKSWRRGSGPAQAARDPIAPEMGQSPGSSTCVCAHNRSCGRKGCKEKLSYFKVHSGGWVAGGTS